MSVSTARADTWNSAAGPVALEAARLFETAWRNRQNPKTIDYLPAIDSDQRQGVLLALLRAEMNLRFENGETVRVETLRDRHAEASPETIVALVYEEFCLRAERGQHVDPADFHARFPEHEPALRRVLDIHDLLDAGKSNAFSWRASSSMSLTDNSSRGRFPQVGTTLSGFRLVEELGRGTFARVYLAQEERLGDRPVALKVARVDSNEPLMLARLQHTHIVPIYSYHTTEEDRLHLICMPYFGRTTLARVFADAEARDARSGAELAAALDRLDPATNPGPGRRALAARSFAAAVAWWGACMADGLQHAHERGVSHRDVKPSNVLITPDGLPMLLDFNLSRGSILDDREAGPDTLGGTLAYMAPEHLEAILDGKADRIDARGDIYSLGIMLHEMLVGARPFSNPAGCASAWGIMREAIDERRAGVRSLREKHPEIPPALDVVVRKCLASDPDRRYRLAGELAADLRAVADDGPLRFAHEPQPSRTFRWARRRSRELTALILAMGLLFFYGSRRDAVQFKRTRLIGQIEKLLEVGGIARDSDRLDLAIDRFQTAARLAGDDPVLRELAGDARSKAMLASQTAAARELADRFSNEVAELRLPLVGPEAAAFVATADAVLDQFHVLRNPDWFQLADLKLLDPKRRARLFENADDLLFLRVSASIRGARIDEPILELCRRLCDRALLFTHFEPSWQSLRARVVAKGRDGELPTLDPIESARTARGCARASLLMELDGRLDDAIVQLKQSVDLDPSDYWTRLSLARLLFRVGRVEEALEQGRAAIAINKERPDARRLIDDLGRAVR